VSVRRHLFIVAALGFASGCTTSSAVKETPPARDSGVVTPVVDGGADGSSPPDCFSGTPKTYEEIINACTDAVKIDKKTNLPLLLPDGGLPQVP
jgi:hypothetical protein